MHIVLKGVSSLNKLRLNTYIIRCHGHRVETLSRNYIHKPYFEAAFGPMWENVVPLSL